jgi:RNA polymerase sigma factor (TIGR02999 family)
VPEKEAKSVTELLGKWRAGDSAALDALVPLVYSELQNVAHNYLRAERPEHTLQTTALVHEAYLRLVKDKSLQIQNRPHFFAVAAHLMRQILVDYARSRKRAKRDAGYKITLDEGVGFSKNKHPDLVDLDDALIALEKLDNRQSRIVELRFFGGLSIDETSEALGVSAATVRRDWGTARVWLRRELDRTIQP